MTSDWWPEPGSTLAAVFTICVGVYLVYRFLRPRPVVRRPFDIVVEIGIAAATVGGVVSGLSVLAFAIDVRRACAYLGLLGLGGVLLIWAPMLVPSESRELRSTKLLVYGSVLVLLGGIGTSALALEWVHSSFLGLSFFLCWPGVWLLWKWRFRSLEVQEV